MVELFKRLYNSLERSFLNTFSKERLEKISSVLPKPLKETFFFIIKISETLFLFSIKIDLYIVGFTFYSKLGFTIYAFSLLLFVGFPKETHPPLLYMILVWFFIYSTTAMVFLYLLFRIPSIKRYLTDKLGEKLIRDQIGNPGKAAMSKTILLGGAVIIGNAIDIHFRENTHNAQVEKYLYRIYSLKREDPKLVSPGLESAVHQLMCKEVKTNISRVSEATVSTFNFWKTSTGNGQDFKAELENLEKEI